MKQRWAYCIIATSHPFAPCEIFTPSSHLNSSTLKNLTLHWIIHWIGPIILHSFIHSFIGVFFLFVQTLIYIIHSFLYPFLYSSSFQIAILPPSVISRFSSQLFTPTLNGILSLSLYIHINSWHKYLLLSFFYSLSLLHLA